MQWMEPGALHTVAEHALLVSQFQQWACIALRSKNYNNPPFDLLDLFKRIASNKSFLSVIPRAEFSSDYQTLYTFLRAMSIAELSALIPASDVGTSSLVRMVMFSCAVAFWNAASAPLCAMIGQRRHLATSGRILHAIKYSRRTCTKRIFCGDGGDGLPSVVFEQGSQHRYFIHVRRDCAHERRVQC